jgi:hypothetical protein
MWTTWRATTKNAVLADGERRRPLACDACAARASARRTTFGALRVQALGSLRRSIARAFRVVDNLPPNAVAALCIPMVSVAARSRPRSACVA